MVSFDIKHLLCAAIGELPKGLQGFKGKIKGVKKKTNNFKMPYVASKLGFWLHP